MEGAWDVVEEKTATASAQPAGEWDVAEEKPAGPDISLWEGVKDFGKTAAKSVGAVPAAIYQEFRHPIDSVKTLAEGATEIPGNMWEHASRDIDAVGNDFKQAGLNPDWWQKALRYGRGAMTAVGAPLDVAVGAPYESTVGKLAEQATGGSITAADSALLPMLLVGGKVGPKAVRKMESNLASDKSIAAGESKAATPDARAAQVIAERFQKGQNAGAPSLKDALEQVQKARENGRPMALSDFGGEGVRSLGGYVARAPGESRDYVRKFLNDRDAKADVRLIDNLNENLAQGSVLKTAQQLAEQRSAEGRPLFEEAYRGGSMAPLERQFEVAFDNASKNVAEVSQEVQQHLRKITQLKAKLATQKDVYANAGTQVELKQTEAALGSAEMKLTQAQEEKASVLDALRTSQNDKTSKAPGAVWNPNIQRLMSNPNLKKGISKGIRIEKNLADAEGRPFNISEYAIKGMDEQGEPIVGKVPNMRLLAAAKEGLDDILQQEGMRDKLTGRLTKEGISVDKLRRALLTELDQTNPAYKAARGNWAGHSRSMEALRWGQDIFNLKPEDIAAEVMNMGNAEKEFARLGLADNIREKILKTGISGDEAKSIIKNKWMREQLRPLFESEDKFDRFVNSVLDERTMFENQYETLGNSASLKRLNEDVNTNTELAQKGAKGVVDLLTGKYWKAFHTLLGVKRDLGLRNDPKLNEAIAKMLFDPNVDIEKFGPFMKAKP